MVREIEARSALTRSKLPASDYCINPYVGCTHACTYCYARFMRRFTGHSDDAWGTFVDARVNLPQILSRELDSGRHQGSVLLGSVTDAYQPAEKRLRLTRNALELLASSPRLDVSVLTKSDLVTRDIDIFTRMESVSVGLTLTCLNTVAARALEPRASAPQERVSALQALHQAGIRTYVFIGPVIPLVTSVSEIIKTVGPFVDEVWGESLNLRGADRQGLNDALDSILGPEVALESLQLAKNSEYWDGVETEFKLETRKVGLDSFRFFRH